MTGLHETEGDLESDKCVLFRLGLAGDTSKLVQLVV